MRSRRPLLQWTREIPVGNELAEVATRMTAAFETLRLSTMPKLALYATPGAVVSEAEWARFTDHLPNLTTRNMGSGGHCLPYDQRDAIGQTLREWISQSITARTR